MTSPQPFAERFLHVDMDAFFAEVERLHDPSLVGVPVIVGGLGNRGVVATASYEARAFGVGSAMPMVEARRRCPHARFVSSSHARYRDMSDQVFGILRSFTPLVEGLSVDEAFLDVAGLRHHYESPASVGRAIRHRIRTELRLPASVGGAPVKFIAKMASGDAKPDGLLIVPGDGIADYLHPKPVRELWGVGGATLAALEALGIATIGDVAAAPADLLVQRLGPSTGAHLHRLANGIDDRIVETSGVAKSVSVESTYDTDLHGSDAIDRALLSLCDELAVRLARSGWTGRTVTLKLRFGDFDTVTRSMTTAATVASRPQLLDAGRDLLGRITVGGRGVRLLGIGVSHLVSVDEPRQLDLLDGPRSAAAEVVEEVRTRFGRGAIGPARLNSGRQDADNTAKSKIPPAVY